MKKTDMNLLARYKELNKLKARKTSPGRMYIAIIVVVLLLLGSFSVKLVIDNQILKDDIKALEGYINHPNIIARMNEITTLQNNIKTLNTIKEDLDSIQLVLDSIPRFDSMILGVLYTSLPPFVKYEAVLYNGGSVIVSIVGPRPSDASNYVLRLQRTGYFKSVTYKGYSYDAVNNRYVSDIHCILKGGN